ncbi:MAG: hypothetical protein QOJ64_4234 [Acidobacteriota bacterium]|jgi:hypothetical protein|nr:hypothetical protein [Acidobacteriota bacterium]
MLFVEGKTSKQSVGSAARLALLEKLQEKGLTPLIRSTRLHCYEQALLGPDRVDEMERAIASWSESDDDGSYLRGDVFCFEDFVLFLIFGNDDDEKAGMRAGIVYEADMLDATKNLDAFCRNIDDALDATRSTSSGENGANADIEWETRDRATAATFAVDGQEVEPSTVIGGRIDVGSSRAAELLEDLEARRLLHRITESQAEGRVSELLSSSEHEGSTASLINRMADAGLLRREVLISCRRKGRSLFRLPSPDALSVITASNATCSECGTAIADEKIEDLINPTELASQLLEDGSWLTTRMYSSLRELRIPDSHIAIGPPSDDGGSQIMVSVCNGSFLFVTRDGDVTAVHARQALSRQIETDATHLVVVASGKIHDDARMRLREHARRRARGGGDVEVILIEGVDATEELRGAFERVSEKSLVEELCALDSSLGLKVGHIVAMRFKLMQKTGALKDLAESAVGALAGSLREF